MRYAQIAEGGGRTNPERSIAWPMHLTVDVKFTVVDKGSHQGIAGSNPAARTTP